MRLIKERRTTPHDLGEYRAGLGRIALSQLYPRVRVTFDWQVEAFYSFVIEIPAMRHGRRLSFGKSITEELQANPQRSALAQVVWPRRSDLARLSVADGSVPVPPKRAFPSAKSESRGPAPAPHRSMSAAAWSPGRPTKSSAEPAGPDRSELGSMECSPTF
jgi:hypothetical protein